MNNIISLSVIVSASLYVCTQSLTLRIATRSSKLAVAQTEHVCNALKEQAVGGVQLNINIVHVDASGDVKDQTGNASTQKLPLALSGIDFTGALDEAVLSGEVDAAVHSLKDVPPDGRWSDALVIGACLGPRANPLDVLLTKDASIKSIHELPSGSMIGSASIRRQAQLKAINSSLQIINIRGNVDTRLKILEDNDVDSIVLAMAGLDRLGILNKETNTIRRHGNTDHDLHFNIIPIEEMLPGLCQGIIGVTCRRDNKELLSLLESIDNNDARIAASTERAYLNVVQEVLHGKADRHWLDTCASRATPNGSSMVY
jgi:hydroxymethylbilane synthase